MRLQLILFLTLLPTALFAADPTPQIYDAAFDEKISATLTEIDAIQPGQTRKDLLKLFECAGGLQSDPPTEFVYRKCHLIGIDVKFEYVSPHSRTKFGDSPDDVILEHLQALSGI